MVAEAQNPLQAGGTSQVVFEGCPWHLERGGLASRWLTGREKGKSGVREGVASRPVASGIDKSAPVSLVEEKGIKFRILLVWFP